MCQPPTAGSPRTPPGSREGAKARRDRAGRQAATFRQAAVPKEPCGLASPTPSRLRVNREPAVDPPPSLPDAVSLQPQAESRADQGHGEVEADGEGAAGQQRRP